MSETSTAQKQQVQARAHGFCEYCCSSMKYAVQSFECEHIVPLTQGGETALANLAWACGGCNRCKGSKINGPDPDSGQVVALFHPRQQNWPDHFAWNEDFTLIIRITAVGRATVQTLRLNRVGVVNLRQLLVPLGEHPPQTG